MAPDRRTCLGLVAGALAGTAGCLAGDDRARTAVDDATDRSTADSARTDTATAGTTPGTGGTLTLRVVEPDPATPMVVYPTDLRATLRAAATGDGPVRAPGSAFVYAPEPLLPGVDTVELVDPSGEASGVYDVDCRGGIRYRLAVGARRATPPPTATVTPVTDLSSERRDLVVAAIAGDHPDVYPETELGEWVRESFFGGYVSYRGTTYRGRERPQTDAAFFSTEVWYILALSPTTDATDPLVFDLSPVGDGVRTVLDPLLEERDKHRPEYTHAFETVPDAAAAFFADTDRLLTQTSALGVGFERRGGRPTRLGGA